jgi:chorismate mutase
LRRGETFFANVFLSIDWFGINPLDEKESWDYHYGKIDGDYRSFLYFYLFSFTFRNIYTFRNIFISAVFDCLDRLRAMLQNFLRGVRGATTVEENSSGAILRATREMLALIIRINDIHAEDVCSVQFTTTPDLNAEFPALAARQLNWLNTALMCGHEMDVPNAIKKCIRVLIHWNTPKTANEIVHVYIRGAEKLRPDKASLPPVDWEELDQWIKNNINYTIQSNR